MLASNIIKIKWAKTKDKDYFISKGYRFTDYGNSFEVNIKDLPLKRNFNVDIICDKCGTVMNWNYNIYLSNMEQWKGTYCRECKKILRTGCPTISPLYELYLRPHIKPWHIDSFNSCNGLCVISGEPTTLVHHKYSLKRIIYETLQFFKIDDMKSDPDLTTNDVKEMTAKCLELHYKHGLGVCLTKELHREFHSIYGNGNCTPEQFEEFKALKLGKETIYANQ